MARRRSRSGSDAPAVSAGSSWTWARESTCIPWPFPRPHLLLKPLLLRDTILADVDGLDLAIFPRGTHVDLVPTEPTVRDHLRHSHRTLSSIIVQLGVGMEKKCPPRPPQPGRAPKWRTRSRGTGRTWRLHALSVVAYLWISLTACHDLSCQCWHQNTYPLMVDNRLYARSLPLVPAAFPAADALPRSRVSCSRIAARTQAERLV